LLDDTATEISIDQAPFCTLHGFPERRSRDILFPGKTAKPCISENSQIRLSKNCLMI
jgi:hypothetical protein